MGKIATILVKRRNQILAAFALFAAVCLILTPFVKINYDLTRYLPKNSPMKIGMDLMTEEFGEQSMSTLRLMVRGVPEEEKAAIRDWLGGLEHVQSVTWQEGNGEYNKGDDTLYVITSGYNAYSSEAKSIYSAVLKQYGDTYELYVSGDIADACIPDLPLWIVVVAVVCIVIILFCMCKSWMEPVLFLITIGIAVFINMGTNLIMGTISQQTFSMSAILQLVLSMDYSIILLNRYREEKSHLGETPDRELAMERALVNAFAAITSSSITTFVGLLALVFMSFTIGADLGLVMAKGVVISLICIFTVLPALVLKCDWLIEKTAKKTIPLKMDWLGRFSYRLRHVFPVLFLVLFSVFSVMKGNTAIDYTLKEIDVVNDTFAPDNTIVLLYETADAEAVNEVLAGLEQEPKVKSAIGYGNSLGKAFTSEELASALASYGMEMDIDASMISSVYYAYYCPEEFQKLGAAELMLRMMTGNFETDPEWKLTISELFLFLKEELLTDERLAALIPEEVSGQIDAIGEQLAMGAAQLQGENYGRLMITTSLEDDNEETRAFLAGLTKQCEEKLSGDFYLIGNSVMAYQMSQTFDAELNRITWITAAMIFVVVAVTFRSLVIPTILVLLIQCGVYMTMGIMHMRGSSMYFLALIIVQSILMGATIDYAILLTSYYRELRETMQKKEALIGAYNSSIHTILTSAMILILVTGILGELFANPTVGEICKTISLGSICATVLILFVLPGILTSMDRFICKKSLRCINKT